MDGKDEVIVFDINGSKVWMKHEDYHNMETFSKIQQELFDIQLWFHEELTDEVRARVYERHGMTYTPPDPFKLDYYFIITDKGLMARDRKGSGDYQVLEGYNIADKPYEGEYKYIRDARPMDI